MQVTQALRDRTVFQAGRNYKERPHWLSIGNVKRLFDFDTDVSGTGNRVARQEDDEVVTILDGFGDFRFPNLAGRQVYFIYPAADTVRGESVMHITHAKFIIP